MTQEQGKPEDWKDITETLQERGNRYSEFKDHARLSQKLKEVMIEHGIWGSLDHHQKEALEMIQHKVARILNGDPNYKDNWHDIQGYAKLVEDLL